MCFVRTVPLVVVLWLAIASTGTLFAQQTIRDLEVTVTGRQEFKPPHIRGDLDFKGAPQIRVDVMFAVEGSRIYRSVYMNAQETKGDRTTASGWSPKEFVHDFGADWQIHKVITPVHPTNLVFERLPGHSPRTRQTDVGRITVWGDQNGNDVGGFTQVRVDYDYRLKLQLRRKQPVETRFASVALPRTVTYIPPHTRGDQDFKGHGPAVEISVWVLNQGHQLTFNLKMKAKEHKSDWTTAEGTYTQPMDYKPPQGYRIKRIVSPSRWDKVVDIGKADIKHLKTLTKGSEIGAFTIFGDRRGREAGGYTRVVANLTKWIQIELEPISGGTKGSIFNAKGRDR